MSTRPTQGLKLFGDAKPAAQYVRMSTEHQRYSTRNQEAAIRSYADKHGYSIVRTYADRGKSGLSISGRKALQELISDVIEQRADYEAILVYDVSRWGRFQDADESAYYEFICKQAGVTIRYCAEQFDNDGSPIATILKGMKRAMAGEYSRELSAKVFAGQCRLAKMGYHRGSTPGLGLRRMVVDEHGNKKAVLEHGERKAILTDRTVLVPGPPHETRLVVQVYQLFVRDGRNSTQIADQLNREGWRTQRGNLWNRNGIDRILTNENYIGNIIYNRVSAKLRGKAVRNAPADWVRATGVIEPILCRKLFQAAQRILRDRSKMPSDERLLADLKALYKQRGYLSQKLIDEQANLSCSAYYRKQFGSLARAYELVGFKRESARSDISFNPGLQKTKRELIEHTVEQLQGITNRISYDPKRRLLNINDEALILLVVVKCQKTPAGGNVWKVTLDSDTGSDLALVARLDAGNEHLLDYFLFPIQDMAPGMLKLFDQNELALDAYRLHDLSYLARMTERSHLESLRL